MQAGWLQIWAKAEAEQLVSTSTACVEPVRELSESGWWGNQAG